MRLGRRRFIGLLAGAATGAAAGLPIGRLVNGVLTTADQPLHPPRGPVQWVLSVCDACPGRCGVRARRVGERVVKLEGNSLHPVSGGRLCAKGQAAIQALHHPDRVLRPLRRNGPRGSIDSFEPASWDRALAEIASRMQALRNESREHALVLLHDHRGGLGVRLARRLVEAFGSPNALAADAGNDGASLALSLTQGIRTAPAYDLRAADYVLSLGCEFLEASSGPVFTSRAYGDFRQRRAGHRGKFIHADPRLSITGASADQWIPIRPGTHGVLALGLAAAMVAEDLHDREFVEEHCTGFEELRTLLRQHFPLETVSARTGVTVNTILRIARELAGAQSPLILGPRKGPLLPGRVFDHLAAHVLNALTGNIDQPGGVLVPDTSPVAPWPALAGSGPEPRLDGAPSGAPADTEQLAFALLSGKPYRAEVLFVLGADPLLTTAGDRFRAALERVPLVVAFGTVPNDTALHADWILPEPHFLEQADIVPSPSGVPFASMSLSQPAATPSAGIRPVASVVLDLAGRLGLQEAFPSSDADALLRTEIENLYAARRGAIMGTAFDEAWVRMMESAGWWAPGYANAEELWTRSQESGGWWDPFYDHGDWSRVLRTPSGRFDLNAGVLARWWKASGEESRAPAALDLLLFEPLAIAGGTGAELPFLQSLLDPGHEARWQTWGELHPETAGRLGIAERSVIRVLTQQAAIEVIARVTDRVVPGAVAIPVGLGREGAGRWASGVGSNPLRLVGETREPVTARLDPEATRVIVMKAGRI